MTKENKYLSPQDMSEYAMLLLFVAIFLLLTLTDIELILGFTISNIMAWY